MEKIYYLNQENWNKSNYFALHRYIIKMFRHCHRKPNRLKEVKDIEVDKLSKETKVLMFCVIIHQRSELLFDTCHNLRKLQSVTPLDKKLDIVKKPSFFFDIYNKYNVLY